MASKTRMAVWAFLPALAAAGFGCASQQSVIDDKPKVDAGPVDPGAPGSNVTVKPADPATPYRPADPIVGLPPAGPVAPLPPAGPDYGAPAPVTPPPVGYAPAPGGAAPAPGATYVVQRGDTLYGIASRAYFTNDLREKSAGAKRIYDANRAAIGPDKDRLVVGTPLVIPAKGDLVADAGTPKAPASKSTAKKKR
jgi:nucleoid-associated protein YgaU